MSEQRQPGTSGDVLHQAMGDARRHVRAMRRRLLPLAGVAAPLVAVFAFSAHGCSNEPPFESVCLWVGDPGNCFREFREGMLAQRGVWNDNPNGDCSPTGNPLPTEALSDPNNLPGVSNGSFATRMQLDTCILKMGGQVIFNPPLDLTALSPFDQPVSYQITISAADGIVCAALTYTSPHSFSITINPPPDALGSAAGGGPTLRVPYGTYTEVNTPGRDNMDVTCPSGEFHHFNLNELNPNADYCPAFVDFVPRTRLQVLPGGTEAPGAVSLAIFYPPVASPDGGGDDYPRDASAPATPIKPVVYFNCTIPGGLGPG